MKKESGFTMLEVLIVIGLIGVVAAIAIPNFMAFLPNYRLKSATQDLFSNLQRAKVMAVERNENVLVAFESGKYTIWGDGDEEFDLDESPILTVAWSDYKESLSASYTDLVANGAGKKTIGFAPTGLPIDPDGGTAYGSVTLTNSKAKSLTVSVSIAGSVKIQ